MARTIKLMALWLENKFSRGSLFIFYRLIISVAFVLACGPDRAKIEPGEGSRQAGEATVKIEDYDDAGPRREAKAMATLLSKGPEITTQEELISRLPANIVPTRGPVRVVFREPMADQRQVGVPISEEVLTIEPEVKGAITWEDSRSLIFSPASGFENGKTYTCSLDVNKLLGWISLEKPVVFTFTTPYQELVGIDGDIAGQDTSQARELAYQASLTFLEPVTVEDAEKYLTFSENGRRLQLSITRGGNSRTLELNSAALKKDSKLHKYTLNIDKALAGGMDVTDEYLLRPLEKMYVVNWNQFDSREGPGINILFSDEIDRNVDLSGYFRIEPEVDCHWSVDKKTLTIHGPFERRMDYTIALEEGIASKWGVKSSRRTSKVFMFKHKPAEMRFEQSGVILPYSNAKRVTFETMNMWYVDVKLEKIPASNAKSIIDNNGLSGGLGRNQEYEFTRGAGCEIFSRRIRPENIKDSWQNLELDISKVMEDNGRSLYVLNLDGYSGQGRSHSLSKLLIHTDLGLTVKKTRTQLHVIASSFSSGNSVADVRVELLTPAGVKITTGVTDQDGMAVFTGRDGYSDKLELILIASKGSDRSYLNIDQHQWETSSFATGGVEAKPNETKAFIYMDRGVYRPGDTVHVSCIARNALGELPDDHPVTLNLYSPKAQRVMTLVNREGRNGLYCFTVPTRESDITGTWQAVLKVGSESFTHDLSLETVIPNRLKVIVEHPDTVVSETVRLSVSSSWLFGAPASELECKLELGLRPARRSFPGYGDYVFSDPSRAWDYYGETLWEGALDQEGRRSMNITLPSFSNASSRLQGYFKTSVYEPGGNATAEITPVDLELFEHVAGFRPPQANRTYLTTKEPYHVPVVVLDRQGKPVRGRQVKIKVYRNDYYWWYDFAHDESSRYNYRNSNATSLVDETTLTSSSRPVDYTFSPADYGMYFIQVTDVAGGHTSGNFVFASSWGDGAVELPESAEHLVLKCDRKTYQPGDTALVSLKSPFGGKMLYTVEKAHKILLKGWREATGTDLSFRVPITEAMLPNAYVSVSLFQPTSERKSDLPLRMYGVMPILVEKPTTRLGLDISLADELRPNKDFEVSVSVSDGRNGWVTLAVVDEGLLDLTNFTTPDPWSYFYAKERLSVVTSDMYDLVLDDLLNNRGQKFSIGGDFDSAKKRGGDAESDRRFKPVALFSGPVYIPRGDTVRVKFSMPNYAGSVRVMAVAHCADAYAFAEKYVPVVSPLMIFPTAPRVIGPSEIFELPVTVFSNKDYIKKVTLSVEVDSLLELAKGGGNQVELSFEGKGSKEGFFRFRTSDVIGATRIKIKAVSGQESASESIALQVRPSALFTQRITEQILRPGKSLKLVLPSFAYSGTNATRLQASIKPPLNITPRLKNLIRYPHGCLEQTSSKAFPQLVLKDFLTLDARQEDKIDEHLNAAIARLADFQLSSGRFTYWPGGAIYHDWSWTHAYAGHFLLTAREMGYHVPGAMLTKGLDFTGDQVRSRPAESWEYSVMTYELFLLALADRENMGMMNWLREDKLDELESLPRMLLAAAYYLCGEKSVAYGIIPDTEERIPSYREFSGTYGSNYRDEAFMLYLSEIMENDALSYTLFKRVSTRFKDIRTYYSTQETGMTLLALGKYLEGGGESAGQDIAVLNLSEARAVALASDEQGNSYFDLTGFEGDTLEVESIFSDIIYLALQSEGVPLPSHMDSLPPGSGLELEVDWYNTEGEVIDVARLEQNTEFWAVFKVRKPGDHSIEEVALTAIIPAGWEIENLRLSGEYTPGWAENIELCETKYMDIRDDRISWYFDLPGGYYHNSSDTFNFIAKLKAVYPGQYVAPAALVEAMYDNQYYARTKEFKASVVN